MDVNESVCIDPSNVRGCVNKEDSGICKMTGMPSCVDNFSHMREPSLVNFEHQMSQSLMTRLINSVVMGVKKYNDYTYYKNIE
jgi:hypothetical protein